MCDYLHRNQEQLTPRLSSLINSAFYRILVKEERAQVRRQIAALELDLLKQSQSHGTHHLEKMPKRSLLSFILMQRNVLCSES